MKQSTVFYSSVR